MTNAPLIMAFGAYVALVAVAVIGVLWRHLPRRPAGIGILALLVWFQASTSPGLRSTYAFIRVMTCLQSLAFTATIAAL